MAAKTKKKLKRKRARIYKVPENALRDTDAVLPPGTNGAPSPKRKLMEAIQKVTKRWRESIEAAWAYKDTVFSKDAQEAFDFFGGDHQFLFDPSDDRCLFKRGTVKAMESQVPGFTMTYNIVAELVQIFGPAIYHRNPERQAVPILPLELQRDYYIDPVLELQTRKAEEKLNEAITSIAGPLAQQFIAQGAEEQVAQQQAQQVAMQDPRLAQLGAEFQQLDEQLQQANERFELHQALQKRMLAKAYTEAKIQDKLLNYGPEVTDLRTECRKVVDDTLIKGHGVWITELTPHPAGGQYVAASRHLPVERYLMDPDVVDEKECQWVAVQCIEPVWQVEDEWGYDRGTIPGNAMSEACAGAKTTAGKDSAWCPKSAVDARKMKDVKGTNDLLVYYKLYSKMGMGDRLTGLKDQNLREIFESFGDFCCPRICDTLDHPINLHPDDISNKDADELRQDMQWPTPFHKIGEFPTTSMMFHWDGKAWGMSHIKPGIGELKFLDYAMSHLANKVRTASQDLVGVVKAAGDDIKKAFNTYSENGYTFIEIEAMWGKSVADVVSIMQKPNFQGDIWTVISMVAARLDKRLGLTEVAYGLSSTQSRSALDSKNKQDNFSIRPEDMAATVEEKAKVIAKKEAYAIFYHYEESDIKPILGEAGTEIYKELLASRPPEEVIRQYSYTIEAGSIRRPNKDRDIENMNMVSTTWLPVISAYCMGTGDMEPLNWFFQRGGSVYNMDINGLYFKTQQQQNPTPEQLRAMELQGKIAELNMQAAVQQAQNGLAKMLLIEQELMQSGKLGELKEVEAMGRLRAAAEDHLAKLKQAAERHAMEMRQDEEEHDQEIRQDAESYQVVKSKNPPGGPRPQKMVGYRAGERPYR